MLKHAKGNLITMAENGEFDIIVHGCNCHCTMGSGIAREVRERYPMAYEEDCKSEPGDIEKLGMYTLSISSLDEAAEHRFAIVNAYTQFGFNKAGESTDVFEYESFAVILRKLEHKASNQRFGFPYIGMGLAGGDKVRIMAMLEAFAEKVTAKGGEVTLVEFA